MKYESYPKTAMFEPIDDIMYPHPYVIGTNLVSFTAKHHNGILDDFAIENAEKHGVKCCWKGCNLPYKQHKKGLLIGCKTNKELNDIKNVLQKYLLSIKDQAEKDGYAGFAFKQITGEYNE